MEGNSEKIYSIDDISNLEIDIRCKVRKMTADSTDPDFIKAIFYSRETNAGRNDSDGESFAWKGYFVKFVSDSLKEDKSNLDFLLEEAAKSTKLAMLKEYFLENPKGSSVDAENYVNLIDLLVSECTGMYTPAGAFGRFVENVIDSVREAQSSSGELEATIDKLKFMLDFEYRRNPEWKKQQHMSTEFGLGYLTGLVSTSVNGAQKWGNIESIYPVLNSQINSSFQSQRGGKKGAVWTAGMKKWLRGQIINLPTKKTKNGIGLNPSNRKFSLSICQEAMAHNEKYFCHKWTNNYAATDWIQKTISEILNE